jgi:hypothetical protein
MSLRALLLGEAIPKKVITDWIWGLLRFVSNMAHTFQGMRSQ